MNDQTIQALEPWAAAWRQYIVPHLPASGLSALLSALKDDDPTLIQGSTTLPPPLLQTIGLPCEAGCAIAYALWKGTPVDTVGEVERLFAAAVNASASNSMNGYNESRAFLNWFDDTPRPQMIRELIPEVELAIVNKSIPF